MYYIDRRFASHQEQPEGKAPKCGVGQARPSSVRLLTLSAPVGARSDAAFCAVFAPLPQPDHPWVQRLESKVERPAT